MSFQPPTYFFNGIIFNSSFYNTSSTGLTLSQAYQLFLQRTGYPVSTAIDTTFDGALQVDGTLSALAGVSVTGGITSDTITSNTITNTQNIIMSGTPSSNYIQYPDGTKQYTAPTTTTVTGSYTGTVQSTSTSTGTLTVPSGGVGIGLNLNVGGNFGLSGTQTNTGATNSTSTSTGTLIIPNGGAGIGQNLNIGGVLGVLNASNSSSTGTGCAVFSGGLGIAKNVYIGSNLNISGNFNTLTGTGFIGNNADGTVNNSLTNPQQYSAAAYQTAAMYVTGGIYCGGVSSYPFQPFMYAYTTSASQSIATSLITGYNYLIGYTGGFSYYSVSPNSTITYTSYAVTAIAPWLGYYQYGYNATGFQVSESGIYNVIFNYSWSSYNSGDRYTWITTNNPSYAGSYFGTDVKSFGASGLSGVCIGTCSATLACLAGDIILFGCKHTGALSTTLATTFSPTCIQIAKLF